MALNYISDLGAMHCSASVAAGQVGCSPLHAWMDASFSVQGLLIFFGALLVRRLFPAGPLMRVGCGLYLLSGAGLFAVGLAPEDVSPPVHLAGAAVHFLCGSFAMLVTGIAVMRSQRRINLGSGFTLTAGLVALAGTLLLVPPMAYLGGMMHWPVGLVERIAAYPLPIWLTVTGFVLQHYHSRCNGPSSR